MSWYISKSEYLSKFYCSLRKKSQVSTTKVNNQALQNNNLNQRSLAQKLNLKTFGSPLKNQIDNFKF